MTFPSGVVRFTLYQGPLIARRYTGVGRAMHTVVYYNRKTRESFCCSLESKPFLHAELFDAGHRDPKDFDVAVTTGFVRIRPMPATLDVTTLDNPGVLT